MSENKTEMTASMRKTQTICKYLSDKKAYGIVYIDVESKTSLCDYFVICSGRSSTQVKSLAENLEEKMEKVCAKADGRYSTTRTL